MKIFKYSFDLKRKSLIERTGDFVFLKISYLYLFLDLNKTSNTINARFVLHAILTEI